MLCEFCGHQLVPTTGDGLRIACFHCGWKTGMQHGVDCKKEPHWRTGYLHGEEDDSPYDVDGCLYCGRCHYALPSRRSDA